MTTLGNRFRFNEETLRQHNLEVRAKRLRNLITSVMLSTIDAAEKGQSLYKTQTTHANGTYFYSQVDFQSLGNLMRYSCEDNRSSIHNTDPRIVELLSDFHKWLTDNELTFVNVLNKNNDTVQIIIKPVPQHKLSTFFIYETQSP